MCPRNDETVLLSKLIHPMPFPVSFKLGYTPGMRSVLVRVQIHHIFVMRKRLWQLIKNLENTNEGGKSCDTFPCLWSLLKCDSQFYQDCESGDLLLGIPASLDQSSTGREEAFLGEKLVPSNFFLFQATFSTSQLLIIHVYSPY